MFRKSEIPHLGNTIDAWRTSLCLLLSSFQTVALFVFHQSRSFSNNSHVFVLGVQKSISYVIL